ncbi:hexokinase A [Podochytrium sp. JEL0797]|nr:hexokinase A [Podochytrium sp. JEL0797]
MPVPDHLYFLLGVTSGVAVCSTIFALYASNVLAAAVKQGSSGSGETATPFSDDSPDAATVERLSGMFTLNTDKLNQIVKHMLAEMKKGLQADNQALLMIPSHVVNLPNGKETGSYLALDLGGTNFRVCEVVLDGNGGTRARQSKHTLTDAQKASTGTQLFDFFADVVYNFLAENGPEAVKQHYQLGFTFSFAINQVAINKGFLLLWNKGFSNEGVVGKNVVQLLDEALKRRKLDIDVTALVNDTTGTLVSHAYIQPSTRVGVILGTGTNAAYVEKIENITKYTGHVPAGVKEMIINMEWGAFDDEMIVIPRNKYDKKVDRSMNIQGGFTFEKMISGMYLGEIVRFCLVDLVKLGDIFKNGGGSAELQQAGSFETAFMSRIERDHTLDLSDTRTVLEDMLKVPKTTLGDRRLVKTIVELVGKRSARLAAAGIAAVVTKMNKLDGCTVGIDGSLFELYPHYSNRMRDTLRELLGVSSEFIILEQARDGSGQGAALIAAKHDASSI